MDSAIRPVLEQLKFQTVLMKIDLLFEACDRLAAKRIGSPESPKHELATGEIEQPLVEAFAELFHSRV